MIISRTPFRMSFFGGGTDYPAHYLKDGGAVLVSTFDKYCYVSCRILPPFFDHKYRVVYSNIENTRTIDEINHPAVKGVLSYLNIKEGMEIHHDGDLPARSGLGSSSAFTAGLLKALYTLQNKPISSYDLGLQTVHIEQKVIGEKVGSQDQISVSMGGMNLIQFNPDTSIKVTPLVTTENRKSELNDHLLLFFTGVTRDSQTIAGENILNIPNNKQNLKEMFELVFQAHSVLQSQNQDIKDFGRLLHESWLLKKNLSKNISTSTIDNAYQLALENGAIGGKILGAGGGGFFIVFADPNYHQSIKSALSEFLAVPFAFEESGCTVLLNHGRDRK